MKKLKLYLPISLIILGVIISSGESFGKNKHYIVKLKGNVLYANGHGHKKTAKKNTNEQEVADNKANVAQQPVVQETQPNEVVVNNNQPPATQVNNTSLVSTFNYEQRQVDIHTSIFQMYPGTYLDSMSIVTQLLSDSIRQVILKTGNKDSIDYLKVCLQNSLKDSIILEKLSKLSNTDNQTALNSTGVIIARCKDASSSTAVDSVVMDVFDGSTLVASGTSDKTGTIMAKDIPDGNYYVVFSRKNYEPFSLMKVKIANAGQSYIDIPLAKQDSYVFKSFGKNAWLFISTGVVVTLFIMVLLAFYLAKFTARRSVRTSLKNSAII